MHEREAPVEAAIDLFLQSFVRPRPDEEALSADELWAVAPGVVLEVLRVDPRVEVPRPLARAFGDLAAELGLTEGSTLEELESAFAAHYRGRARLIAALSDLRRELRGVLSSPGLEGTSTTSERLGSPTHPFQPRSEAAPLGAVKAQPWARFALLKSDLKER